MEAHEVCRLCGEDEATTKVDSLKVCGACLDRVQPLIAELARAIGPGFDTAAVPRVREIGEELNRIGGMSLMIAVSMKSSEINPRVRGFLGKWWDGVGEWVD